MTPVNFSCPVDIVKAYDDNGKWIIEGYAATTDFDLQGDNITAEAIRGSAKDLIQSSTVLHNHNPDEAIGKVLESKAQKNGLWLKIMISKTVPDLWKKIQEGVLNKFSIRGKIIDAVREWVPRLKAYVRRILKMRLVEVSLVAVPANPKAKAMRWYVQKALDEFVKAGGEITVAEGETEMDEKELLEAEGDPEVTKDEETAPQNDFPAEDELARQWAAYVQEKGLAEKSDEEVAGAWLEFCQEKQYPYPKPYPHPQKPDAKAVNPFSQIVFLVDKLISGEKDGDRKKLLQQVKAIASSGAAKYPKPQPPKSDDPSKDKPADGNPPKEEPKPAGDAPKPDAPKADETKPDAPKPDEGKKDEGDDHGEAEKAGRKVSSARVKRLRKLLEELSVFIEEVDADGKKAADAKPGDETVETIAKALGIETSDVEDIVKQVGDLRTRLGKLERPGTKASLDGQEKLPGESKDGKKVFKNLI